MESKACIKCSEVRELSYYNKAKSNKDGHRNNCKDCEKLWKKEYRENNKKKIAIGDKIHYEANVESISARKKVYYLENREKFIDNASARYNDKKEHILKQHKIHYKDNKESIAVKCKLYRASDSGKLVRERGHKKREEQIRRTRDGSIRKETLELLMLSQDGRCPISGNYMQYLLPKYIHLDHIVPLSRGGTHTIDNVQWTYGPANMSKANNLFFVQELSLAT